MLFFGYDTPTFVSSRFIHSKTAATRPLPIERASKTEIVSNERKPWSIVIFAKATSNVVISALCVIKFLLSICHCHWHFLSTIATYDILYDRGAYKVSWMAALIVFQSTYYVLSGAMRANY